MALVIAAHPLEHDVLRIVAVDDAGNVYEAFGWQSALTNHFDADAYAEVKQGKGKHSHTAVHRRDDAVPRSLSDEEAHAYVRSVLFAAHPQLAQPVEPAPSAPLLQFSL